MFRKLNQNDLHTQYRKSGQESCGTKSIEIESDWCRLSGIYHFRGQIKNRMHKQTSQVAFTSN